MSVTTQESKALEGWAKPYILSLLQGETVSFRPRGGSMMPIIRSGQLVTVAPVGDKDIGKDSIVLCVVQGSHYLHLVKNVSADKQRFLIGNNKGGMNGWIGRENIFGLLVPTKK